MNDRVTVESVLRGNALRIYLLLLKNSRPMRVREIQRTLKFSSPSLVAYHLSKMYELGIVKKTENDLYYASEMVKSSYLADFFKIKSLIFPRFLFYSVFATATLVILLTKFRPFYLTQYYLFSIICFLVIAAFLWYETFRFWKRHFSS